MKEATVKISINRITVDRDKDDGYDGDHFVLVIAGKKQDITIELTDAEFTALSMDQDLSIDKELIVDE